MNCPKCAKANEAKATECKHCETPLAAPRSGGSGGLVLVGTLVVLALGLTFGFVLPRVNATKRAKAESMAMSTLRSISTAQTLFREGDKERDTYFDYGTLTELIETGLLDAELKSGTKQGYVFLVAPHPSMAEILWTATANPQVPGSTGNVYFATNQVGVIWASETGPVEFDDYGKVTGDAKPLGIGAALLGR